MASSGTVMGMPARMPLTRSWRRTSTEPDRMSSRVDERNGSGLRLDAPPTSSRGAVAVKAHRLEERGITGDAGAAWHSNAPGHQQCAEERGDRGAILDDARGSHG